MELKSLNLLKNYIGVILDLFRRWNHHINELTETKSCDGHDIQNTLQLHKKCLTFAVLQPISLTPFIWFISMGDEKRRLHLKIGAPTKMWSVQ